MFFSSSLSDAKTSLKRLLLQCIQIMGYDEFDSDSPSSNLSRMSGKKLTALAIVIIIRVFFGIPALFGFPLKDLLEKKLRMMRRLSLKMIMELVLLKHQTANHAPFQTVHIKGVTL
jgi:hypothetical protein